MSSAEQVQGATAPAAATQETNLLDQIVERTKPQDAKERERNRTYVDEFLRKTQQHTSKFPAPGGTFEIGDG